MLRTYLIVASLFVVTPAFAQDSFLTAAPEQTRSDSINVNPIGFFHGTYSVNYEHLWHGTHGLLVEGTFLNLSDDASSSLGAGASIGYRWHWSHSQDSGFLGVNAGFWGGVGDGTVTESGMTSRTFDVDVRTLYVVGNIGRRWQWQNGLNLTFRVGAGVADYEVSTHSSDPQAQKGVKQVQDLLDYLPIALDGELSLGYSF